MKLYYPLVVCFFVVLGAFQKVSGQDALSPEVLINIVKKKDVKLLDEYVKETWPKRTVYKQWPWITEDVDQSIADSIWNADTSKSARRMKSRGYGRSASTINVKVKAVRYFEGPSQPGKINSMLQAEIFNNGKFQIDYLTTLEAGAGFKKYLSDNAFTKLTSAAEDKIQIWEKDGISVRIELDGYAIYIYQTPK